MKLEKLLKAETGIAKPSQDIYFNLYSQDEVKRLEPSEPNKKLLARTENSCNSASSVYGIQLPKAARREIEMDAVYQVIDKGMTGEVKKLAKLKSALRGKLDDSIIRAPRRSKRIVRGAVGDEIDMQRVYSGDVGRAWRHGQPAPRVQKDNAVALVFRCSYNWGCKSRDIKFLPVVAAFISEHLIASGINAAIYYAAYADIHSSDYEQKAGSFDLVPVKSLTEPLNPVRLMTMLSLAYFRSYGFKISICSKASRDMKSGLQDSLGRASDSVNIPEDFRSYLTPANCGKIIDISATLVNDEWWAGKLIKKILEAVKDDADQEGSDYVRIRM